MGQRFRFGRPTDPGPWTTVVGVSRSARETDPVAIVEEARPTVYAHASRGVGRWLKIFAQAKGVSSEALVHR